MFSSTFNNLADKCYNQFEENHFTTWKALKSIFCVVFQHSNLREELIVDSQETLKMQLGETFAELVTRAKALVGLCHASTWSHRENR